MSPSRCSRPFQPDSPRDQARCPRPPYLYLRPLVDGHDALRGLAWPLAAAAAANQALPPANPDRASLSVTYVDSSAGVDGPACGASTGAAACKTIGYALANRVAAGGTVSVAAGAYNERIVLRAGIKVQGAGASVTTLDGGGGTVVTVDGAAIGSSTVLSGFTVTGGSAEKGGGLRIINGAAPLIEQNVFRGNTAAWSGGAIYTQDASPTIRNNTLRENTAVVFGGAIHTWLGAALIQGNTIENNAADWGGGMMVDLSAATVSGNTLRGNRASGGGALLIYNAATCTVTANLIEGNHASATEPMGGGGMNVDVAASPVLTANIIRNNTGLAGGGINLGASGLGTPSGLTAHGNILCGNEGYQFYNETTAQVDLTGNWWGTNAPGAAQLSGPAIVQPGHRHERQRQPGGRGCAGDDHGESHAAGRRLSRARWDGPHLAHNPGHAQSDRQRHRQRRGADQPVQRGRRHGRRHCRRPVRIHRRHDGELRRWTRLHAAAGEVRANPEGRGSCPAMR